MNLDKVLEFQKKDIEYKNLNDKISGNADHRKMKVFREEFDTAKQKATECEATAAAAINTLTSAEKYLAENIERIDALTERLSSEGLDGEEESTLAAELERLRFELGEWEKKLSSACAGADKALGDYRTAINAGMTAKVEYDTAKKNYKKFCDANKDELENLKAEREKLAAAVEPELMALYKSIIEEKRYPAFVAAGGDDKSPVCGVCGMMLADQAKNDLKNNGYCRCETCRRIIYRKQDD